MRSFFLSFGAAATAISISLPCLATSTLPSNPVCPVKFAPSDGVEIPANVPALAVATPNGFFAATALKTDADSGFSLSPDPVSPETFLLTPITPLDAGVHYDVSVAFDCDTAKGRSAKVTFDAMRIVELPKRIGSLAMGSTRFASTSLLLSPTSELTAFLPVTRFEVHVRGIPWAVIPYGEISASGDKIPIEVSSINVTTGSQLCSPEDSGMKPFGVEVRAHVAGATTDPEPTILPNAVIDCTRPPQSFGPAPTPSSSDGCSMVSRVSSGGAVGLFALGLGAAAFGRRRITASSTARRRSDVA